METESPAMSDSTADDSSQPTLYCYCKTENVDQFMICCEKCEEWFHGTCINMEPNKARNILKWYCNECQRKYGFKIQRKVTKKSKKRKSDKDKKYHHKKGCSKKSNLTCRCNCSCCLKNRECGNKNCSVPYKSANYTESRVHPITAENNNNNDENSSLRLNVKSSDTVMNDSSHIGKIQKVKTCFGLDCNKPARFNSKYCSDDCGLILAKKRILSLLPMRIEQRNQTPCVANELDSVKIQGITFQKECTLQAIEKLKYQREKLVNLINRSKQLPIIEVGEDTDDEKMQCITCGCEIPTRSAFKHMEFCFRKLESQTEILSYRPDAISSEIFCHYHDEVRKTYCKRLRYLCPDHFKPEKPKDNEVCGCPLISVVLKKNMFSEAENFCQRSMKKCDQHFYWDKLAHSEIDFECLRESIKLQNLIHEEETIRQQIARRSGLLGLLLHSTEEHINK